MVVDWYRIPDAREIGVRRSSLGRLSTFELLWEAWRYPTRVLIRVLQPVVSGRVAVRRQRLATGGQRLAAMGPVDGVAGEQGGRIGLPAHRTYELSPGPRGTRLSNSVELDPPGALGLLGNLFTGRVQASVAENLGVLRTLLEGAGA
jgi:hypothetical protein